MYSIYNWQQMKTTIFWGEKSNRVLMKESKETAGISNDSCKPLGRKQERHQYIAE